MLNRLAAKLIRFYQKYISPHKGFRCAYAVKHQDLSCSEYARVTLLQTSFFKSLALIRHRFHDCKLAAAMLNEEREKKRNKYCSNASTCNCADVPEVGCDNCNIGDIAKCDSCT